MPPTDLSSIRKAPSSGNLNAFAYDQLRFGIMSGRFRPGDSITLRGLAEALGVSMMPARDTIIRLLASHALESHGRVARVPVLDAEGLADLIRIRMALEGEAVALSAMRATDADVTNMEAACRAVDLARLTHDLEGFLSANLAFHFAIYQGAHCPLLLSMIEKLWLRVGPLLSSFLDNRQGVNLDTVDLEPHKSMLVAIRDANPEAGREALVRHIRTESAAFKPIPGAGRGGLD